MFTTKEELSRKLTQAYAGDQQATEDFFTLVHHIAAEQGKLHTALRETDAIDDFANFVAMSIWRQVKKKKIDPSGNVHSWIIGACRFRIQDYLRKSLTTKARDTAIECHLIDELLARGIREDEVVEGLPHAGWQEEALYA